MSLPSNRTNFTDCFDQPADTIVATGVAGVVHSFALSRRFAILHKRAHARASALFANQGPLTRFGHIDVTSTVAGPSMCQTDATSGRVIVQ